MTSNDDKDEEMLLVVVISYSNHGQDKTLEKISVGIANGHS